VHIEKGDRRGPEKEIPNLKTWYPEFLNIKICNSHFPKSELGIPGSWIPELKQAQSRSPGKGWECKFMSRPYFLFSIRIHVRCRHRSKYLLTQTKFNVSFIFFDNQLLRGLISFKLLFQRNMKNKKNGQNDKNGIFIVWNNERSFFFLILLRFSFVFFIMLRFRKSYRMVLSYRLWALFDYWIFPTCHA
jgi:hypothetical protein